MTIDIPLLIVLLPFPIGAVAFIENQHLSITTLMVLPLPFMLYIQSVSIVVITGQSPVPLSSFAMPASFFAQLITGWELLAGERRHHRYDGYYHYRDMVYYGQPASRSMESYSSAEQTAFEREILSMDSQMSEGA